MGYTHGCKNDEEFRTCTCCGKKLPNTTDFFSYANKKAGRLKAVCKECDKKINKIRRQETIEKNKNKSLFYDGTRTCKKCGRELPNNKLYFPIDYTYIDGLRNICRECNPNYGKFLNEDYSIHEKWDDESIELLKSVYHDYTGKELAEKFFPNRTVRAIECQAANLGIIGKTEETVNRANKLKGEIMSKIPKSPLTKEQKDTISRKNKEYYKTHNNPRKGTHLTLEEKEHLSILAKERGNWSGKNNPRHINPLVGEDNGRWNGGTTPLYLSLREKITNWKQQSMIFCDYKCVITGENFDEIHHTMPFKKIVDEAFDFLNLNFNNSILDYSGSDYNNICVKLNDLHDYYGFGICLNKKVHKLFHDTYGYTHFDVNDFLHFINRIRDGEFDEWFANNDLGINLDNKCIDYLINLKNTLYKD